MTRKRRRSPTAESSNKRADTTDTEMKKTATATTPTSSPASNTNIDCRFDPETQESSPVKSSAVASLSQGVNGLTRRRRISFIPFPEIRVRTSVEINTETEQADEYVEEGLGMGCVSDEGESYLLEETELQEWRNFAQEARLQDLDHNRCQIITTNSPGSPPTKYFSIQSRQTTPQSCFQCAEDVHSSPLLEPFGLEGYSQGPEILEEDASDISECQEEFLINQYRENSGQTSGEGEQDWTNISNAQLTESLDAFAELKTGKLNGEEHFERTGG